MNQIIDINSVSKFIRKSDRWHEDTGSYLSPKELLGDDISLSPSSLKFTAVSDLMIAADLVTRLVLRKINNIICSIYRVKQSNRNDITNNLKHLLRDRTPIFIIKTDIHSFYESIDMQNILNKLTRDKIVSFEVMEYIRTIFSGRTTGLPRGLNISASFAELYMREFDTKNKMFDRVGYFARYVDDIVLIFYTQDNLGVNSAKQKLDEKIRTIKEELKKIKLSINYKKTEAFYISQKGNMYTFTFLNVDGGRFIKSPKIKNNEIHFDYLGYRYIRKDAKVTIKIAKNKINKIKSRIYNSFLLFRYDNDYNLLEKRIRYLFSNHQIYGSDDNTLYTGIYYSYPQCDPDGKFLNSIEIFYRNILKEYRHSISSEKYKILKILSITAGYEKKIVENFSLKEIKKILSGLKHYE